MKRALLFVILLAASLLIIAVPAQAAAAAATCQTAFATAGYPPGWTQISSTPDPWSQTDGNVIAADFLYTPGGPFITIGGNFTKIREPGGNWVPARNLAVLRLADGKVVWGASSMSGYVKTIQARWGVIYVGGGFTSINGIARKAIAAFDAYNYSMLPWAPVVDGGTIRAMQISDAGVAYLGGNGGVMAFSTSSAQRLWTARISNGVVKALLMSPDQSGLFVGGLFNKLDGVPRNQLAEIYPISTGKVYLPFNPQLRPNSIPGSTTAAGHDGEVVLELTWDWETHLVTGTGGAQTNTVKSIAPWDGGQFWSNQTEGDTQAVATLGNTVLSGMHRSHGNLTGCPFYYFGTQWANQNFTNFVLPWDPGLNNGTAGKPTNTSYLSEANGGISEILVEPRTRKVYVLGDFTAYGGTCAYDTTAMYFVPCSSSTPLRGVARYSF